MTDRRTLIRALALAALAFPALAAAQPAAPRVAALSLVGDRLLVVGSQMSTGSRLDRNAREVVALPDDGLDIAAAREAERAAKAIRPGLDIVPIRSRDPAVRSLHDEVVAGNRSLRDLAERVAPTLAPQGITHLLVLTRHRGEARIRVSDGAIGIGRLEGLGFYVDRWSRLRTADAGGSSGLGFLAPFAYFRASLVDLRTLAVLGEEVSALAEALLTVETGQGVHPWDTLTAAEKSAALERYTARGLEAALPALLAKLPPGK